MYNIKPGDRIRIARCSDYTCRGKEGFVERIEFGCLFGTWDGEHPLLPNDVDLIGKALPYSVASGSSEYKRYTLTFDAEKDAITAHELFEFLKNSYSIPEISTPERNTLSLVCTHDTLLEITRELDKALKGRI